MNSRSLVTWARLEEQRRTAHKGGLQSLGGMGLSLALGGVLAAEVTRRLWMMERAERYEVVVSSIHLWMAALVCVSMVGVFSAPFKLYWRRDSKLLASLSIPGKSLFALALWRSHRGALHATLGLACALVPIGVWVDWELSLRLLVPLAIGFSGAAWLGPSAAFAAGGIVASEKAQSVLASMGGEFQAPKNSWLGLFPGLAATALAVALIAITPWTLGQRPPGGSVWLIVGLSIVAPFLGVVWAWTQADSVIPAALREVAALDQEILASVELSTPSGLENKTFSLFLKSPKSLLVARKDASLSRRRYPSPFFLIPCGIAALWIVAASQPSGYLAWAGAIYGGLLVYTLVMAKRSLVAPIEIPALLATLPISKEEAAKGKLAPASLRLFVVCVLGGIPMVLRAPQLPEIALFLALATGIAVVGIRAFKP